MDKAGWELAPENAHPKARTVLDQPFYWNEGDDDSPLGNDTGADTFHAYRAWQADKPSTNPLKFLRALLRDWEVADADWGLLDPGILTERLEAERFQILTRDDVAIALAFAQIVLEGRIHPEIQRKALLAVERQALDPVISFRGWTDPEERRQRLIQMRDVLNQDWSS